MLRLFLGLYIVLAIGFAGAITAVDHIFTAILEDPLEAYNRDAVRGPAYSLVEQLRPFDSAERERQLQALQPHYGLQLRLVNADALGLSAREQALLASNQLVVRQAFTEFIASIDQGRQLLSIKLPEEPSLTRFYTTAAYFLLATLVGIVLYFWVRPHWRDLEQLRLAAERFGDNDLSTRLHLSRRSNIRELAEHFNRMASRIEGLIANQRELTNAVSHELRTPLTRLDFGLALALSDDLPATSRERLQGLVAHIRELDELVLELLSYSRLQIPAQLPEQVEVSLDEFIDSILGSVDDELESPDIVIDVSLHGSLERFTLDPRLTARAIQNLLRNATRYCEKRIKVGVQVSDSGCEIWVDDDGIGIPDDERERVFEPFYRLDRSRDRATGGFGLGLAISRRALEAQGGALTVEASPLGGARFRLWLPTPA